MIDIKEIVDNETGEVLTKEDRYSRLLDERGREVLDSTPIAIPVGFRRPETLSESVARLVRSHAFQAHAMVDETMEEADDFDIPDDPLDPNTPWENDHDLAMVNAMDHGVVTPPTSEELSRARDVITKAKNYVQDKLNPKDATPPPRKMLGATS